MNTGSLTVPDKVRAVCDVLYKAGADLLRALVTVSTLRSLRLKRLAWAESCLALEGKGLMKKANLASGLICRSRVSRPSILAPNLASPVPYTTTTHPLRHD